MAYKKYARIDIFSGVDELQKFLEFAEARGAKTRAEREAALAEYKKADLIVEEFKERVEARIVEACKKGMFKKETK